MTTPTGGSWNNDQQGQGDSQSGQGGGSYQGQSLGQGFDQQQSQGQPQQGQPQPGQGQPQQSQPGQGQPQQGQPQQGQPHQGQPQPGQGQGYGQPGQGQPAYGQQGQPQQPPYGQQAAQEQGQRGGFGQAQNVGRQFTSDAGKVASGASEGVGELFSDLHFKKSLTEKIASLTFLGVIIWAVLRFISNLLYNFGSQDFGDTSVKNMSSLSAIVHSVTDLVWLVVIVAIVRLVLELAINVARIAQRSRQD